MGHSDDKLRAVYQKQVDLGSRFEAYEREGVLETLDQEILREIFNEAYDEFLKCDPREAGAVAKAQAKGQVIIDFKKKFLTKIEAGRAARRSIEEMDALDAAERL